MTNVHHRKQVRGQVPPIETQLDEIRAALMVLMLNLEGLMARVAEIADHAAQLAS